MKEQRNWVDEFATEQWLKGPDETHPKIPSARILSETRRKCAEQRRLRQENPREWLRRRREEGE